MPHKNADNKGIFLKKKCFWEKKIVPHPWHSQTQLTSSQEPGYALECYTTHYESFFSGAF